MGPGIPFAKYLTYLRLQMPLGCAIAWLTMTGIGQSQVGVVRVEEDWELEISQPDAQLDAPQVVVVFKPFGNESNLSFEIDLNHATTPAFQSGGIQLRVVDTEQCLSETRLLADQRLTAALEVVRWTQVGQRQSNGLVFGILNGSSDSWGQFGGEGSFVILGGVVPPINYSPENSLQNSGVAYASNRVKRLTLVRVRLYDAQGRFVSLPVDASVHQ